MNSKPQGIDRLSVQELRDSREAWWTERFTDFIWSQIKDHIGGRSLEVGCGTGVLSQRLGGRLPADRLLVGIDLDPVRVEVARLAALSGKTHPDSTFCVGDGRRLPFGDRSFSLSISILTLQHVADPEAVLGELKRVTRPGGVVVCIEPDNVGQRIYLPRQQPSLDDALLAFWREVRNRYLPKDIAIGPSLPRLFKDGGLEEITIEGYLISKGSWSDQQTFFERTSVQFETIARRYDMSQSPETRRLKAVLKEVEADSRGWPHFYSISTVPVLLTKARA